MAVVKSLAFFGLPGLSFLRKLFNADWAKFWPMGKTGSIEWVKIKGRKGQVRQVSKAETTYKKPGPMQRYDASGSRIKKIKRSAKATSIRT
jgi:hypothetical protein